MTPIIWGHGRDLVCVLFHGLVHGVVLEAGNLRTGFPEHGVMGRFIRCNVDGVLKMKLVFPHWIFSWKYEWPDVDSASWELRWVGSESWSFSDAFSYSWGRESPDNVDGRSW